MEIAFIVPAYNEQKLLGQCLRSIKREVARSKLPAEIVVVNNGSTDQTKSVALRVVGVRVVDAPQRGLVYARDAGLHATTASLLANIDADTILPTGWIDRVIGEFRSDSHLVALSGPFLYYDLSISKQLLVFIFYGASYLFHSLANSLGVGGVVVQGGNFVLRRDALLQAGGFDTTISFYGEDTDIARRLNTVGRVKWTFSLYAYSSGRRLLAEGLMATGWTYALNWISVTLTSRPYTTQHVDFR